MRANSSLLIEYIKKEMSLFAKYKRHTYSYKLVLIFYASLIYLLNKKKSQQNEIRIRQFNRPLPSSKNSHFQKEARCTTFL